MHSNLLQGILLKAQFVNVKESLIYVAAFNVKILSSGLKDSEEKNVESLAVG
jgi:hypothetical protein